MNKNAAHFFRPSASDGSLRGNHHHVVDLQNDLDWDWQKIQQHAPATPKGWYELARLKQHLRIEFTRDYWLSKMAYHTPLLEFLPLFFANFDDVGVYLLQKKPHDPYQPQMLYTVAEEGGFYIGGPPCSAQTIEALGQEFSDFVLPCDYLSFLQIHDGFRKSLDFGLIEAGRMKHHYLLLQSFLQKQDPLLTVEGVPLQPNSLIPFYESYGLHCYQCFFADWYPQQQMGNFYYSGIDHSISDFQNFPSMGENLAFPTFLDWLLFYLKGTDDV